MASIRVTLTPEKVSLILAALNEYAGTDITQEEDDLLNELEKQLRRSRTKARNGEKR